MAEKSLQEILLDDLMGNSSKSPRENAAVAEILRLQGLLDDTLLEKKHGKAEKGSTAKKRTKSDAVN